MGRTVKLVVAGLAVAGAVLWASPGALAGPRTSSASDGRQVEIQDNVFRPRMTTVQVGETLTWVNDGANEHTTTSDSDLWDSGTLRPGDDFSFTFEEAGIYTFYCEFHRSRGMVGSVVVTRPDGSAGPARPEAPAAPRPPAPGLPAPAEPEEEPEAAQAAGDDVEAGEESADKAAEAAEDDRADTGVDQHAEEGADYTAEDDMYVVRPGDTLSGIAARFGVPLMSLAYANGIYDPDYVRFGTVLVIPDGDYGDAAGSRYYESMPPPDHSGYAHMAPAYGYGAARAYGYAAPAYGYMYGHKPYGYHNAPPSYGYGKPSYGYAQPGYGKPSYGYAKPGYGYGCCSWSTYPYKWQPDYGFGWAQKLYGTYGWGYPAYGWPYKK
jgi:plastocyanin/LysM repeat protein